MPSDSVYPEMKPSGVDWLGDIPAHWDTKRLKYAVSLINEKTDSIPVDRSYIGLENIESYTGRIIEGEENGGESACNLFSPGDVLFCKLRPYLAKAIIAPVEGGCTTELLVLRPKLVTAGFLFYFLLSDSVIKTVDSSTYGTKMPRASWDFIGDIPQLLPPLEEQQAIAGYLDRKTAQIDAVVREKARQIELLGEHRQALISHAVTRGIDSAAPVKPSGIAWLGDVPAHWKITRLKFVTILLQTGPFGSQLHSEEYVDDGVPHYQPCEY